MAQSLFFRGFWKLVRVYPYKIGLMTHFLLESGSFLENTEGERYSNG